MLKMSKHLFKLNYCKLSRNIQRFYNNKQIPELPPCDFNPKIYDGPSFEKLQKVRYKNLPECLLTFYNKPLALHQGHLQWIFDINGKRYLDMYGGICTVSVGHSHPKVTDYVTEQLKTLVHCSNIYFHPQIHEYAEKLTNKLPGNLKVVYFVNSGSEANDLAILIARVYTGNFDIVSLTNGYHGMSYLTMGISNTTGFKYPVPGTSGMHQAMNPDIFRGPWGGSHCRDSPIQTTKKCSCKPDVCTAKDKYLEQLSDLYNHCFAKNYIAAFFAESIQGIGGTVQYPKGYLKGAYELVKQQGGLFVADEVQTGFGRTGDHFWGFEMHGIQPDIVTMAKGIGNGFPLAAVVTTPEIAAALNKGKHFNTFGGNPVACAAGRAVLDVIEEENYQENSKEIGTYLLKKLAKLRDVYDIVGDVRGKGLMIGVELVEEKGTIKPLSNETFVKIWEACRDMGLLIGRGGNNGNVIRIKPPMCVTKADAKFTVAVLDKVFSTYSNKK